jgi:hypothetical protein
MQAGDHFGPTMLELSPPTDYGLRTTDLGSADSGLGAATLPGPLVGATGLKAPFDELRGAARGGGRLLHRRLRGMRFSLLGQQRDHRARAGEQHANGVVGRDEEYGPQQPGPGRRAAKGKNNGDGEIGGRADHPGSTSGRRNRRRSRRNARPRSRSGLGRVQNRPERMASRFDGLRRPVLLLEPVEYVVRVQADTLRVGPDEGAAEDSSRPS